MPALLFPVGTVAQTVPSASYSKEYSGIVLNQNSAPANNAELVSAASAVYQTFTLPSDYIRDESVVPSLTGFQVYSKITAGSAATATITWRLDMYVDSVGWTPLTHGSTTGSSLDGDEVWFTVYFDKAISLHANQVTNRFRISVSGSGGVLDFWYSNPNPLALSFDKLYNDANSPVTDGGNEVSLLFRILADVADSGVDFLGNIYRSAVLRSNTSVVTTADGRDRDAYWLSAPQPSQFAVVSQYFDVTHNDEATVLDGIMVDPVTPGVYFHVYYSTDSTPGTDADSWDNLMWTPVPTSYQLTTRTNYYFPKPILAKYIKVEYSHLQAKSYAPGNFQKPIVYKKHPKWVTDYFLARILAVNTEDPLTARRVQVIYDSLDFAFNYYRDDLSSAPTAPLTVDDIITNLKQEDIDEQQVDPQTLAKIRVVFQPYLDKPALTGRSDYILGSYLNSQDDAQSYPTEEIDRSRILPDEVSSLEREPVIVEKSYPVMFFYVQCRHGYRVAQAFFEHDRGYFAGVNEVAFLRERYDSRTDTPLYLETAGDLVNVQRNDFETVDFSWVTYRDS